jgi:hypothetical protein
MNSNEPTWTKQISSEQVCSFFYAFAIIYGVIGALGIGMVLWSLFYGKLPTSIAIPFLIHILITSSLAFITALFHYLVCTRALLDSKKA